MFYFFSSHYFIHYINTFARQCQQVDDQVFKTYAYMPIEGRTADLPPSLKTLKHVDISESGCSFHTIFILLQDFLFPKIIWINSGGIRMSTRQAAVVCHERPSLIRFEEPFPVLPGMSNLGCGGPSGSNFFSTFTHFSDYLAVLRSVERFVTSLRIHQKAFLKATK